jgi:hypothetical protein
MHESSSQVVMHESRSGRCRQDPKEEENVIQGVEERCVYGTVKYSTGASNQDPGQSYRRASDILAITGQEMPTL